MLAFENTRYMLSLNNTQQLNFHCSIFCYGRFPLPIRSGRSSRSPKFPDQARPTAVHDFFPAATRPYTTPTRPLTTPPRLQPDNHTDLYSIILTHTRFLLDQLDLYSISTRSDRPSHTRVMGGGGGRELVVYGQFSVQNC